MRIREIDLEDGTELFMFKDEPDPSIPEPRLLEGIAVFTYPGAKEIHVKLGKAIEEYERRNCQ